MISLGKYPQISMKQAKAKVREYMDMLEQGINPSTHRQVQKIKPATEQDFKTIALQWHAKHYQNSNERHTKLVLQRLEKYIFPTIGKLPLTSIEAPMLFNLIEGIQEMGNIETGKRVNSCCSMIFRYGVAKGYCTRDVTQDYRGTLKSAKPKHSETVNKTLRGIQNGKYINRMVSHGFRAMASTILNENKFRPDIIEKRLAHQERNKIRGACNHAEYLEERTEMMQWYADYLDGLRDEVN